MCSDVINLEVVFDLNIKDIELITGSFLGLLGLLLGGFNQDLLRLFLLLDEFALPARGIRLLGFNCSSGNLGLLVFGLLFLFFFLVFFYFLCFLEPFDKRFYCCTEGLLSLAVVENTRFIELCLAGMPLNDEFILEEDLVADNQFHEGRCEFNLLWVAPYEE